MKASINGQHADLICNTLTELLGDVIFRYLGDFHHVMQQSNNTNIAILSRVAQKPQSCHANGMRQVNSAGQPAMFVVKRTSIGVSGQESRFRRKIFNQIQGLLPQDGYLWIWRLLPFQTTLSLLR